MTTFFVNREVVARADTTFTLDIPESIVKLGNNAIRAYIKENSDWRNDLEVDMDLVVFEKDSE